MFRIVTPKIVLFVLLSVMGSQGFAQSDTACGETDDKKAQDLFKKGTDKKKYQKPEREAFLKQAIALDANYAAANFTLAEELVKTAYADNTSFDPATPYFLSVITACPHYHSDPYYYVGLSYFEANKYPDAIKYFQKYIDFKDDDVKKFSKDYDSFLYDARQKIKIAKFYNDLFNNKVPFDPHMVPGLCTNYDEYLAIISPDNQLAFFTRRMPYSDINSSYQKEDNIKEYFMLSHRQNDGTFETGKPMPAPFNRGLNEGGPAITIDNNHLYFTICKDNGAGGSSCQIYCSDNAGGKWGDIKNLGSMVNDASAWNSQPSISSDGQTLYFSSNRPGGMGKCDLYQTKKDPETGKWGQAENMGKPINTPMNEKSPFIHTDSHTLYFSSDGLPGAGGFDIFYSRMDSIGKWTEPKNIGYPINSEADEVAFFVSTDGYTGYFFSNDPDRTNHENMGGFDVYQFPLYKEARPEKVGLMKGKITDENGQPLTGATVTITDAKTHKKAAVINDTVNASFAAVVTLKNPDDKYVISVNKKGYAFNSGIVTIKDTFSDKPEKMDFDMKTIASGSNYVLHDIYYKSNSAQLELVSIEVIKEFAKFMKENPSIKVKIAGYTDNVGSEQSNQSLSSDRAFTVMQALAKEGIKGERLSFQGYGAANPVASNDNEEGRAKNRRTEFIILQK